MSVGGAEPSLPQGGGVWPKAPMFAIFVVVVSFSWIFGGVAGVSCTRDGPGGPEIGRDGPGGPENRRAAPTGCLRAPWTFLLQ